MTEIKDRVFHSAETFGAYLDCEKWLQSLGCSIGSMQRGAPTAVMFADNYDIGKNRNLRRHEVWATHGWIHGGFREGPITFGVTPAGKAFLAQRRIEEAQADTATAEDSASA